MIYLLIFVQEKRDSARESLFRRSQTYFFRYHTKDFLQRKDNISAFEVIFSNPSICIWFNEQVVVIFSITKLVKLNGCPHIDFAFGMDGKNSKVFIRILFFQIVHSKPQLFQACFLVSIQLSFPDAFLINIQLTKNPFFLFSQFYGLFRLFRRLLFFPPTSRCQDGQHTAQDKQKLLFPGHTKSPFSKRRDTLWHPFFFDTILPETLLLCHVQALMLFHDCSHKYQSGFS